MLFYSDKPGGWSMKSLFCLFFVLTAIYSSAAENDFFRYPADKINGRTTFRDASGKYSGRAVKNGNRTIYYDASGKYAGKASAFCLLIPNCHPLPETKISGKSFMGWMKNIAFPWNYSMWSNLKSMKSPACCICPRER